MTRVILGSASSGRLGVLRNAGIEPSVVVSGVDEDAIIAALADAPPAQVVCALAEAKAADVVSRLPVDAMADSVVIGCDSMLYVDGTLRGKPGTVEAARRQWHDMAGRSGELYTGHSLIRLQDGDIRQRETECGVTTVHFGEPSAPDLEAYLASGEPLAVAGSFTLDGRGGWFIDRIDGDPSNVIGLSLPLTRSLIERLGLTMSALWPANSSSQPGGTD
jgi:septum formation protein